MDFVNIKKENDEAGHIRYSVSALFIERTNGSAKKIPHPLGSDVLYFDNLEDAKRAIELAGYSPVLPDGNVPVKAYRNAGNYDEKIYNALLKETKNYNPNIVASAISALGELDNKNAIDIFIEKMGEDNEKIRNNAIEGIVKFGISAIPKLFNALNSQNWVTRNSAIYALKILSKTDNAPIEKILDVFLDMLSDENPIVKCSVIEALGSGYVAYKASL